MLCPATMCTQRQFKVSHIPYIRINCNCAMWHLMSRLYVFWMAEPVCTLTLATAEPVCTLTLATAEPVCTLTLATAAKFLRKKCHFKITQPTDWRRSRTFKITVPNYIYRDMSCGYSVHYGKWHRAVPPNGHYTAAADDIGLLPLRSSILQ